MPELPEVETVCRKLQKVILGRTIASVQTRVEKLRRPLQSGLADDLCGLKIEAVSRIAKFILIKFCSGQTLLSHLGMTGYFSFYQNPHDLSKHDHIVLNFVDGSMLAYNDVRRFGEFFFAKDFSLVAKRLEHFAKDPFDVGWSTKLFFDKIKHKKAPVKTVLLDQSIISGLGNIYVCEALFLSKVSPQRLANSLSFVEAANVFDAAVAVLNKAIDLGGSSIVDYQHPDGKNGTFQENLWVYSRAGKNCLKESCDQIVQKIKQAGRSTFFCSACQK